MSTHLPGDPPRLSEDEALRRALAFLERVGVEPRAPWVLTKAQYLELGFYDFNWSKFFHGIELPAWMNVMIDPKSGEVQSYTLQDDPVLVPLTSRLSLAQAVERVAEHQGYRRWAVRKVQLTVSYQPHYPGPQVLAWWIELTNPEARILSESEVLARVNALTGEIISAAIPSSSSPIQPGRRSRPADEGAARKHPLPKLDLEAAAKDSIPPTVFELAQGRRTGGRR